MNYEIPMEDDRPTLLLADDDIVVLSALSAQLGGNFNLVAVAHDAGQAIELAAQHQPMLALVDVQMPGGGARSAVPEIRKRSPRTCVFILSGDETRASVLELLHAGASGYLRKGLPATEIAQALRDALSVSSAAS